MRTFLAALAGLVSVVFCFAAVPALWLEHHVVQEEGFIGLTAPLGEDDQFKQSLAETAAEVVIADADFPVGLAQLVRPIVEGAASSLTDDPRYLQAWTETLRGSHQLTFDKVASTQADGALLLDIAPLVSILTSNASDLVGAEIPMPERVPVSIGASSQQQNVDLVVRYAGLGAPFAFVAAAAFVLSLLAARRRSTTVALIGVGLLVAAAGWKLGADLVAQRLVAGAEGSPLGALFARYFIDAAQTSFLTWIIAGAGAGAVLVMVGGIGRVFASSQN